MYARSTTVQASLSSLEEGIAFMRDRAMPQLTAMKGCRGLSLLVDRETGRCIATTSWETQKAMRATAAAVQGLRDDGSKAFGGSIEDVQEWEIALLHREHETREGTCVRVSWLKADASRIDQGVGTFRDSILPDIEQVAGFCSASVLVDRATGLLAAATAWDDRAAMERSREVATRLRTTTASEMAAQIQQVREFELALAHLRVPELV